MQAFNEFKREDKSFWFFIRFISEKLGYSKNGEVLTYTAEEIEALCAAENVSVSPDRVNKAVLYCNMRAQHLNSVIEKQLMDVEEASALFEDLRNSGKYNCKLIMNKQSGEKKKVNYFTAIITMLAEGVLGGDEDFDPDPRGLVYLLTNNKIIGASSRRFDGAYPSIYNPKIVWEIKEYYYSKSFGSRVADAVYEAELDGYEFNEIYDRSGQHVFHVMFIDSHYTFWELGKSYLCRFIDTLNMGLIDELIVGREVVSRWPELLAQIENSTVKSYQYDVPLEIDKAAER